MAERLNKLAVVGSAVTLRCGILRKTAVLASFMHLGGPARKSAGQRSEILSATGSFKDPFMHSMEPTGMDSRGAVEKVLAGHTNTTNIAT